MEYKNSALHKATLSCQNCLWQLKNKRRYTVTAINDHRKTGNTEQENFFKEDLVLIDRFISKL